MDIFSSQSLIGSDVASPTSLQFGPDNRLYVSEQDGTIKIYDVSQGITGQWTAVLSATIDLISSIPNHNDDGIINTSIVGRQVTGILVTGTAANPVIYVTSSDPRISFDGDVNLDTNSGILSRLTFDGSSWSKVDLIRGLPRSEENHSTNGLALSPDGTKLYIAQGGNTNNGAPSESFAYLPEYALAAAILEVDLIALNAIPNKTFTYSPGVTSIYKYDLPTLNDPTVSNDGLPGHETAAGLDVSGPFGGNDGLNQAVLPADAPLRIYATGFRNAYDVAISTAGLIYTIDNGSNPGLGDAPIALNGEVTNLPNDGGSGAGDSLHLVELGDYYGHPTPTRANPDGALYDDNGIVVAPNLAALVPAGLLIQPGFLIDPSKFTGDASRLALEGTLQAPPINGSLATFGASTNGFVIYNSSALGGALFGDLIAASFDGNIKWIQLSADGSTVEGVADLTFLGGVPLDVAMGPNGTVWVAQIGASNISVLTPSDQPTVNDLDDDDDGIPDLIDPFQRDPTNGTGNFVFAGEKLDWDFSFAAGVDPPGPNGLFLGLTGHMVNGITDFLGPVQSGGLDLSNVKIGTAAGGGLIVIENVSDGDVLGSSNDGEFAFQTGVTFAENVQAFTVRWSMINPFADIAQDRNFQQIGGFIGTGDQDNFLRLAVGPNNGTEIQFLLEFDGVLDAEQKINADALLSAPSGSDLVFELDVDRETGIAVPRIIAAVGGAASITYEGNNIDLNGTSIFQAINGTYVNSETPSGLAVGLWSSNVAAGAPTFQAIFDSIEIDASPSGAVVKAINAGGGAVTVGGISYEADTTAAPNSLAPGSQNNTGSNAIAIAGTDDDVLHQTERFGDPFGYDISLANGQYQLELDFAEIYFGAPGGPPGGSGLRVFDVTAEGQLVISNLDLFAAHGAANATSVIIPVTVSDGVLDIDFAADADNAKLSALVVREAGPITSALFQVTPNSGFESSSYDPGGKGTFVLSNTGGTAITSFTLNLANSLIPGVVFDPDGVSGDDVAEGFDPNASNPVTGTATLGNEIVTGGFKTLTVGLGGGGLAPGQQFKFAIDLDPKSIDGAAPGPNNAGSTSGFEILGSTINISYANGTIRTAEFFDDGSQGGAQASIGSPLRPEVTLSVKTANGIPVVTQTQGNVIEANIPGLEVTAGQAGVDAIIVVAGPPGHTVRLAVAETGGLSNDATETLGSHEGNTVLQAPTFFEASIGPGGTVEVPISLPAPTTSAAGVNGLYTVVAALVDANNDATSLVSKTVVLKDAGQITTVIKAINSGGGAVTVGGISYEADTTAAPNSLAPGSQNNTFSNAIAIAGTNDDVLHQTERWGDPFGYDIPLANGQYQLELDFAEIYFGAPGGAAGGSASRVFDVTVEGLQVISNLDLFAAHGAANATSIFIPVTVSDGVLDIDFAADADNAKLSALVVRSGAPGSGPGPLVFKLIDADNGQVIDQDVSNGVAPLDPSVFAGQLTLVGFAASGQTVSGPVTITLTGNGVNFSKVENTGPYSLFGDSGGTTFGGSSIQPGAYTVGANANGIPQSVAFTLQAIAQTPSLAIAATDASKAEGNTGSTPFTFTVTRSGSTTGASSANYTVAGSGANPAAAADFTGAALATGIVSFAAGEAAPKLITINVAGDITAEANEGFTVTLSAPSAGTTIATAAATGTIVNDDASGPGPGPLVFKLIDADNGQVIDQDVSDGVAPLDPSVFAGQLTLAGFAASGQTVSGPVTITLTGNGVNFSKVENTGPYSLFGDSGGTTFGGSSIQPGAYTVGANANSIPQSAAFTLQAIADVPGPVIKAINAGGGAVTVGGISYEADTTAAPNSLAPGSDNFTFNNAIAIAGTNNDVLHQSERWGDPFGYDIPLANGQYQLELDFAEIYFGAPGGAAGGSGSRVFDVTVEGLQVISNLDLFDDLGAANATSVIIPVTVSDGVLDIDFAADANNAKLSALVVYDL